LNPTVAHFQKQSENPQDNHVNAHPHHILGHVIACDGARATISATTEKGDDTLARLWSIGRLISIEVGTRRIVALVYAMKTPSAQWQRETSNILNIEVELAGEIRDQTDGKPSFSAGITSYPHIGASAHQIRNTDLAAIYDTGQNDTAVIGHLTQDETIDASIHLPSLIDRHFAIVGTTGVGKSTAVSLLLGKAIKAMPELRIMILDPHNEFAAAFPQKSMVIDTDTLELPFWLFRLEEFTEVVFRGRPQVPEETDILRKLIAEAKRMFAGNTAEASTIRRLPDRSSITADTPVPYRLNDLIALIDDQIGRLEGRAEKPHLRTLKNRIVSLVNDPRFRFMFHSNTINDTLVETMAHLFRIPDQGRPITTFQLAGIPSEVVDSVASVLCRMAFEIAMWGNQSIRMLVVCEEAHRYVPADRSLGFVPTRQAIARIAKEGRKYGVSLGVITQRPGELDPTILSQCSTVFAMRLANEHDQEIIRSAIADSSTSTTSFLSAIGNGEAIAFGEAVAVPMRMRFQRLLQDELPRAETNRLAAVSPTDPMDMLRNIAARMRSVSQSDMPTTGSGDFLPQAGDSFAVEPSDKPLVPAQITNTTGMAHGALARTNASAPAPQHKTAEPSLAELLRTDTRRENSLRSRLLRKSTDASLKRQV